MAVAVKTKRAAPSAKAKAALEPVRDAERTRQALLAAAEVGSTRGLLARASTSSPNRPPPTSGCCLYCYFGSKEDLYIAVLERAYGAMRKAERELNLSNVAPLKPSRSGLNSGLIIADSIGRSSRCWRRKHARRGLSRARGSCDVNLSLVEVIRNLLGRRRHGRRSGAGSIPVLSVHLDVGLSYFYFSIRRRCRQRSRGRWAARPSRQSNGHAVGVIIILCKPLKHHCCSPI